jgi:hypothetical protein
LSKKKIRVSGKTQLFTPKTFQPVEAKCCCASERRMVLTDISNKSGKSMRRTAGKVQENSSDSFYSQRSELDE